MCEGIVIRATAGQYVVAADGEVYACRVRGRLKKGKREVQTVVVAGDRVAVRLLDGETRAAADGVAQRLATGVIEEVLPRRNRISRRAARRSGGRVEQVLMANLDQVVAVQSVAEPAPTDGFVDRLLVAAERYDVAGLLCLNKCDLDREAAADPRWEHYTSLGYTVLRTSAVTGEGCELLSDALAGKVSLLLGASGVGKSSLLNTIQPDLGLRVRSVTEKTGLGRHTTTRTELFPVQRRGYIADSPGLRGFDLWDVEPIDLREFFPEIRDAMGSCRYRTCLHRDEPGCSVKNEVTAGSIPTWRYEAYLALLRDVENRARTEHEWRGR